MCIFWFENIVLNKICTIILFVQNEINSVKTESNIKSLKWLSTA